MSHPSQSVRAQLEDAVDEYRASANIVHLLARLRAIADGATPDEIIDAAEPYREMPEVTGPLYERVVEQRPMDARALVILANAYWLSGRGPDVVGALAARAIAADAGNRGAWHLWALSEAGPRQRVARWKQVCERFPADDLAHAALADNAASLAGAEEDPEALALALETYETLRGRATQPEQRQALDRAMETLRGWRL
jgi:hypothetical protein